MVRSESNGQGPGPPLPSLRLSWKPRLAGRREQWVPHRSLGPCPPHPPHPLAKPCTSPCLSPSQTGQGCYPGSGRSQAVLCYPVWTFSLRRWLLGGMWGRWNLSGLCKRWSLPGVSEFSWRGVGGPHKGPAVPATDLDLQLEGPVGPEGLLGMGQFEVPSRLGAWEVGQPLTLMSQVHGNQITQDNCLPQ